MSRPAACAAAPLLSLLLLAPPARASTALPATVEGLARASDAVVRGTVAASASRFTADGRQIYTFVEIRPAAVWRGSAPARTVVRVPGGEVGNLGMLVPGSPRFTAGEEVVLFLRRSGEVHQLVGLAQGKFSVAGGAARPDLAGLHLLEQPLPAGERRAEAMALEELERRVRSAR
jgi:hypothetical protein